MSYSSAIDQLSAMTPELHTQPGQPRRKFSLEEIGILLEALGNPHQASPPSSSPAPTAKARPPPPWPPSFRPQACAPASTPRRISPAPTSAFASMATEISNDDFASAYFRVHAAAQQLVEQGRLAQPPSFFEHLTAMAFLHFAGSKEAVGVTSPSSKSASADASTPPTSSPPSSPSSPTSRLTTPSGSAPPSTPSPAKKPASSVLTEPSSPSRSTPKPTPPSAKSPPPSTSTPSAPFPICRPPSP